LDKIPFSVYDFFAYLSSGTVVLATGDYVLGLGLVGRDKIGPIFAVVLIVLAYVCGHIVAHFSSFILEYFVVGRLLNRPNVLLLGEKPGWRVFGWMFPNYCRALPEITIERVNSQLKAHGLSGTGEGVFLHAYALITANPERQQRLDAFRNQYGFARNMCFAFSLSAVAILVAQRFGSHPVRLRWAMMAVMAAVTLFYRYLKFLKQFSYELFLRYAELPKNVLPEV